MDRYSHASTCCIEATGPYHAPLERALCGQVPLVKDRIRLLNRLKTQTLALTKRRSTAQIRHIGPALEEIEAEIKNRLRSTDQSARAHDIVCSIPGISNTTAAAILIECPEIGTLTRKQIARLAGVAPITRPSGPCRGKSFIQGGRKFLRDALCMPTLVAARLNLDMKAKYKDMCARGKPKQAARPAIMQKKLARANTLIKYKRMWVQKIA